MDCVCSRVQRSPLCAVAVYCRALTVNDVSCVLKLSSSIMYQTLRALVCYGYHRTLLVHSNHFSGPIPSSIGSVTRLSYVLLDLSRIIPTLGRSNPLCCMYLQDVIPPGQRIQRIYTRRHCKSDFPKVHARMFCEGNTPICVAHLQAVRDVCAGRWICPTISCQAAFLLLLALSLA